MTIRHLKVFLTVADTGKMSLAAQKLYIAQPTVSQTIGELERAYGVLLFERLSRRLYLTEAGERLLTYARHIVPLFEEMERQMQYSSQHLSLHIGATITVGICLLTGIINRFEASHPELRVHAFVDSTSVIEEKILKSELDLGLVEGQIKHPDLVAVPMMEDEVALVCGMQHPFADKEQVEAADLAGQAFILRERGSGTRELFEQFLAEQGVQIEEKWVCHSSAAIKNAVIGGQGLSVISKRLVEEEAAQKRLHIVELRNVSLTRMFSLIYHKNKFLSAPFLAFIEQCRAAG